MRENIIKVLNSIKNVSKVENDDQSFIVIANNIDGEEVEYTINFDNNFGISARNNFTGVFSNDFNNEPFVLNTIYKTLKEMIGENKISFTEKFGKKIVDNIKKIQLMDKNNYLSFLKFSCKFGNPVALKNLMLEYKNYFYNLTDDEKQEIIELVCYSGSAELVRILLNNEKINPKNGDFIGVKNNDNKIIPEKNFKFGFSALKGAFEGGNFEIFDFFIENKIVDINIKNKVKEETILQYAIRNNYPVEVVEYLLSFRNINVNVGKPTFCSPIHLAAVKNKNVEVVRTLLAHPEIGRSLNAILLHDAIRDNNIEILKLLIARPEIMIAFNNGKTLHRIIKDDNLELLKILLTKPEIKKNFKIRDGSGNTPLHIAIDRDNIEIINLLLNQPEIRESFIIGNSNNDTPLHIAISKDNNTEIIRLLLAQPKIEESFSIKGEHNDTPLHVAIYNNDIEIVKLLLSQSGIEKSFIVENDDGKTPLHIAVTECNDTEITKLLLDKLGIEESFTVENEYCDTPIYEAVMCGNIEAVKLLMSHKNIKLKDEEIDLIKENFGSEEEIINLLDAYEKRKKEEQEMTVPENLNIVNVAFDNAIISNNVEINDNLINDLTQQQNQEKDDQKNNDFNL